MTDPVDILAWRLVTMFIFRSTSEKAHQSQVSMIQVKLIKVKSSKEYFRERKDLDRLLL